ncbi:DinB family protein [Actinomadura parmotrematis]|uniref:DinB family protein n=1 Tax=Actinomadura parmotrematis TaxID=2864039 RepID=A0ABS7G5T2_9ACTN|nr:DinB family protein [Actinomadura parmotrematis]MBW8487167.1 DinB family protein [Actinomadura parmotrematis]
MDSLAPEPPPATADPAVLLDLQIDRYRRILVAKLEGLTDEQLRSSILPSGWTPLELLKHLAYVEIRWLRWGFLAEDLDDPWGDRRDDRWYVAPEETLADLTALLRATAARSREIAAGTPLDRTAPLGGRFALPVEAPTLGWILVHLLQEYARHVGQLDVVRELLDGATGE